MRGVRCGEGRKPETFLSASQFRNIRESVLDTPGSFSLGHLLD